MTTNEIGEAISPDHRWRAVVTKTDYPSLFSAPTRAVRIGPAGLSRLWINEQTVTDVDEDGVDENHDKVIELKWLDAKTLRVSASDQVRKFYKKTSRCGTSPSNIRPAIGGEATGTIRPTRVSHDPRLCGFDDRVFGCP